jgi:hypothetical protein
MIVGEASVEMKKQPGSSAAFSRSKVNDHVGPTNQRGKGDPLVSSIKRNAPLVVGQPRFKSLQRWIQRF